MRWQIREIDLAYKSKEDEDSSQCNPALDEQLEEIVGVEPESSGEGFGCRDLQFTLPDSTHENQIEEITIPLLKAAIINAGYLIEYVRYSGPAYFMCDCGKCDEQGECDGSCGCTPE